MCEETKKCRVIAVANQKGGVGKTAVTSNLGVGLALNGKKVLVIDADPQGNLTSCLGVDNSDELENTLASFIEREINETQIAADNYILHNGEGVDLMPCNIKLAGLDYMIMNALSREHLMEAFVEKVQGRYDYILIGAINYPVIKSMKKTLIQYHIPEEKIVYFDDKRYSAT